MMVVGNLGDRKSVELTSKPTPSFRLSSLYCTIGFDLERPSSESMAKYKAIIQLIDMLAVVAHKEVSIHWPC
jgi:hypothetical protein